MNWVKIKCAECEDEFKAVPNAHGGKLPRFCTTCRYRRSPMAKPCLKPSERRKKPTVETEPRSQP